MFHWTRRRIRLLVALLAGLSTLVGPATLSHGATGATNMTLNVSPGTLSVSPPSPVAASAVTLNGTKQTSTAAISGIGVVDARGSGAGWTLSATATDFSSGGSPAHYILFTNMTIGNNAPTATDNSSSPPGNITLGTPAALTGSDGTPGTTASSAQTMLTAPSGQGMGSYSENSPVTILIPATTYASSSYASTVTFLVQ